MSERPDHPARVVAVTGASSGIGQAIAEAFLTDGCVVYGLSRRPTSIVGVRHLACDVGDADMVQACFARLLAESGRLDVLVNAAGVSFGPVEGYAAEIERFRRTVDVDLTGAYACALAATEALVASGGAIVNVTSINSRQGFPRNPGYVAAKAGLAGLTRALAVDLGPRGVRVNAVAPGYVRTQMTEASHADPQRRADRARHTVLGRWGETHEIAQAVLYLASPGAAYVSGQELVVDGGWTVQGLLDLSGAGS